LKQLILLLFWVCRVESPLAFAEEEMKVLLGDAIEAAQMALGLVPEVLVDVIFVL
jgi:hypothetical protein